MEAAEAEKREFEAKKQQREAELAERRRLEQEAIERQRKYDEEEARRKAEHARMIQYASFFACAQRD